MIVREHIFIHHMGMLTGLYAYGACVNGCVCVCTCMLVSELYCCSGMTKVVERR